jgi:E3 ubiquitin-protein ligase mind-bomb
MGVVHRVTEKGDIRVQYEGCNNRWTFHPGALTKVNIFAIGDVVRVKHDLTTVRNYQKGHGEWIEVMKGVSNSFVLCFSVTFNTKSW